LLKGVKKVRGIVRGEAGNISMEEIEHFLAPKPLVSGIVEGNIVELFAGPFKGEKARVQNIDEAREEITVELFEAMISIPITVRGDHVRVIEKELK
jgi:transcriptional antiterminator NusG